MKRLVLQVAAISFALAGTAVAADLRRPAPVKAPTPVVVAGYNWTGCYLGGGGGYGMWNQDSRAYDAAGAPFGPETTNGGRGWFGTVQVGCDYQIGSNIVVGAFGDYDFSGLKGDVHLAGIFWHGDEKLKSSWAAGGRIGWLPFQQSQFLVFMSGGFTQARFDRVDLFIAAVNVDRNLPRHTYNGWFLGSGYEYGIAWLPGLFWKTEYRFASYGADRIGILVSSTGAPANVSIDSEKYVHTVRSEIVWRFNFGGPVVARY